MAQRTGCVSELQSAQRLRPGVLRQSERASIVMISTAPTFLILTLAPALSRQPALTEAADGFSAKDVWSCEVDLTNGWNGRPVVGDRVSW